MACEKNNLEWHKLFKIQKRTYIGTTLLLLMVHLGMGFITQDIDECLNGTHGCDVNAECNNTLGSYKCTCKDGFQGNGTKCTGN